jgi:diguanylate cyclase (GGDEF)-like protein
VGDGEQTLKLDLSEVARPSAKRPVLFVLSGDSIGMTIQLNSDHTVVGRGADADFVLRDQVASRQHAEIYKLSATEGCVEWFLKDLGSTNGTYLNGSQVVSEQLLQDGDKIKIGNHLLKFAMLDEFEAEFQKQLHQRIQHDELTGLRSRRSLFADLDREVNLASRNSNPPPITVLMLDLDHFKKVNDARGHLVGSQTIKEVGHIVRDAVGSADMAARYGGEEYFAYIRAPREKGVEIAEKIRKTVESYPFSGSAGDFTQIIRVTVSVGVASFPLDATTALEAVMKADQALYRAKLSGRNRTCVYDPTKDKPNPSQLMDDASAIIYGPADAQ